MTPSTRARWMTIGVALLLTSASQTALAEAGRPVAGTPVPVHPISYQHPTPLAGASADSSMTAPVYRPPHRQAPALGIRVGGGTRSHLGTVPAVAALVPDHTGLTSQASPTLYWYAASDVTVPVEFVLIHEASGLPMLDVRLSHQAPAGIHAVRLADYGITLNAGELYTWSVALVSDPNRRSKDVMAFGSIVRVQIPADLPAVFDAAAVQSYASAGFWYDALHAAALSNAARLLDQGPSTQQGALLRQVGFIEIADFIESASTDALPFAN